MAVGGEGWRRGGTGGGGAEGEAEGGGGGVMAHTQGPWKRDGCIVTDRNGVLVADCRAGEPGWLNFISNRPLTLEELEGNARICEAALISLAACEALVRAAEAENDDWDDMLAEATNLAEAAIAIAGAGIVEVEGR